MISNEKRTRRWVSPIVLGALFLGGSVVLAQTQKEAAPPTPAAAPSTHTTPTGHPMTHGSGPGATGPGMTGGTAPHQGGGEGMMGHGMMGHGMMGNGMMGGMMGNGMMMGGGCPLMGGSGTKVEVKNVSKGVSITITSEDSRTVSRIQKMAEAMRLMHEAASE